MTTEHNEASRVYQFDLEKNRRPTAVVFPAEQEAVVGSIVKLDGRASTDPEQSGLLYKWTFAQLPIGSQVANEGFFELETDGSIVSFAPDVTGHYRVQLVVNDGSLDSEPAYAEIDTRVILVPHNKGLVPDASWIWKYLSDFWTRVEGKRKFDVFWSAAIQIIAAEQLKVYQYNYNKSIRDIQKLFQRRWLSYSPKLDLSGINVSFVLADDQAGTHAATSLIDPVTGQPPGVQADYSNLVSIPAEEGSFSATSYGSIYIGRVLTTGGRSYIMGRSGQLYRAVLFGSDGFTSAGSSQFYGSGFQPSHVGLTLRIPDTSVAGDYVIAGVLNSSTAVLTGFAGPPTDLHNVTYSVLPSVPDSAFFADREGVVPTKQINQSWRFSATLIADVDLEAQGVAPGDIIKVEVKRTDNNRFGYLFVQVISVDRTRLGFVFNLEDLVQGSAAGGLEDSTVLSLADALQVPSVSVSSNGTLVYTDQAAAINSTVKSIKFKRQYYEKALTSGMDINLGPFSVKLTPLSITRNRYLPLADEVLSIPLLQEYLNQPKTTEKDGSLYQITDTDLAPLDHIPYLLVENLDFIIDTTNSITGVCTVAEGEDLIRIPYGDLIDRNVQPGDQIVLALGSTVPSFDILQVVDAETLRIAPVPTTSATGATFKLQRKVGGRYLRFVSGAFSPKKPAPDRLWAEISYFDNSDAIEGNFGVLVGLTREQLENQQGTVSYHSAVAGLMFALVNGPTEANLELAGQILLGLPFAENEGVITEIDQVYRRTLDGAPLYGRILVEARDQNDKPTGITNIYFYPYGRQIEILPGEYISSSPEFSGLAENPGTGKEYAVGDRVKQFAKLSRGVKVETYLTDDSWFTQLVDQGFMSMLEKYHTFRFTANSDVVTSQDIDLCAQFFRTKAKSAHTRLIPSLQQVIPEYVEFTDEIIFGYGRPPVFFDTPAYSLPMAAKFDVDMGGDVFFTFEGQLFSRYISGTDLQTAQDLPAAYSPGGGFINARPGQGEAHDTPFIRHGDVLEIQESSNAGRYPVDYVTDDKTLILTLPSGKVFDTQIGQTFYVYRPIENPLWKIAAFQVAHNSRAATVLEGGFSAGLAVGDTVVFYATSGGTITWLSKQYRIAAFNPLTYSVTLDRVVTEASGTYTAVFARQGLLLRESFGPTPYPLLVNLSAGNPIISFQDTSVDLVQIGFAQPGDQVVLPEELLSFTILRVDPAGKTAYVQPTPAVTRGGAVATLSRPQRPLNMAAVDILDRFPEDHLSLALVSLEEDLTTSAGSDQVSTVSGVVFNDPNHTPWFEPDPWPDPATLVPPEPPDYFDDWPPRGHITNDHLSVLPGDEIEILSGADQGLHVVVNSFSGGTILQLMKALTETHSSPGIAYRIWRKLPNEG